ncbi:hypothetical protein SMD_0560 [Stenotrophomonas maltophilia D457]|nr:hypothetical protein SMD_0560 [Stenotrophomonas maltophilia D457]
MELGEAHRRLRITAETSILPARPGGGVSAGLRPAPAGSAGRWPATATAKTGFLGDGGVGPAAGDAVNPSLGAWSRLARVRCPAHTARPVLSVLPNPPEACLGPMALTPLPPDPPRLRQFPASCRNGSWGQIRFPQENGSDPGFNSRSDRFHPRMAWIYHRHRPAQPTDSPEPAVALAVASAGAGRSPADTLNRPVGSTP